MFDNHYVTCMCVVCGLPSCLHLVYVALEGAIPSKIPLTMVPPPMNYHSVLVSEMDLFDYPIGQQKAKNEMRIAKPIHVAKDDRKLLSTWVRKLQWSGQEEGAVAGSRQPGAGSGDQTPKSQWSENIFLLGFGQFGFWSKQLHVWWVCLAEDQWTGILQA